MQLREAGVTHWPEALHFAAGVYAPPLQLSAEHSVSTLYFSQAPVPSHRPSVPQDALPVSLHVRRGSEVLAATLTHLPSEPGRAQLRHAPVQADSQHTPSTQRPSVPFEPAQSLLAAHFCPLASRPLQAPTVFPVGKRHGWLGAQSPSDRQSVRQAPFAHR